MQIKTRLNDSHSNRTIMDCIRFATEWKVTPYDVCLMRQLGNQIARYNELETGRFLSKREQKRRERCYAELETLAKQYKFSVDYSNPYPSLTRIVKGNFTYIRLPLE
jgi:hypothetical protein